MSFSILISQQFWKLINSVKIFFCWMISIWRKINLEQAKATCLTQPSPAVTLSHCAVVFPEVQPRAHSQLQTDRKIPSWLLVLIDYLYDYLDSRRETCCQLAETAMNVLRLVSGAANNFVSSRGLHSSRFYQWSSHVLHLISSIIDRSNYKALKNWARPRYLHHKQCLFENGFTLHYSASMS